MRTSSISLFILCSLAIILLSPLQAAEYQWSVSIDGTTASKEPGYPRAFLWIPPNCRAIRAVVISENNMEEESILENSTFRATLASLGFAEIWITPSLGSIHFRFDHGDDVKLTTLLKQLAAESGYQELENAPLVPMGHSATASWGWDIAAWNPGRTLAVLSISGQWPYFKDSNMNENSSPDWGDRNIDGVPGLITKGEYEIGGDTDGWYFHLRGNSLKDHPKTVLTQIVEPGGGHFEASQAKINLICLYLRKAAQYRLPAQSSIYSPVVLNPIDPTQTGWLYDEWHLKQKPTPSAPVAFYTGNQDRSFWAFDEEMAKAIETFQGRFQGEPNFLLGYQQQNGLATPITDHAMIHLRFEPQDDGITFKLKGGLWDEVPATKDGKGSEWANWLGELGEGHSVNQGDKIEHPQGIENQLVISRICGPVVQVSPDTFMIQPNRIGTLDNRRSNDIWLVESFAGNATYKPMVQQAELQFPFSNREGDPQTIDFPKIPDQCLGSSSLKLNATCSSGNKISYYVREGPASVDADGNLTIDSSVPPRSKFPIKVTVVACQWGRSIAHKFQTAIPGEQSFNVTKFMGQ